jgi:hypothetical protein
MIIRKGNGVSFELEDGREVVAPKSWAMLHDPDGKKWNACSGLIVPFRTRQRRATPEEMEGAPRDYLGKQHVGYVSTVRLPPRSLASWERVGPVAKIWYTRQGTRAPGPYWHPFGKRQWQYLFTKGKKAVLYRRPGALRIELQSGCLWDDRGIVRP